VLALEADGTVKGCPSLATVGFSGGNVRNMNLHDIWHYSEGIHFGRLRSVDDLWGYCRTCYYNDVCRGGCTWTSHSLLGKPGNNPYCHYRTLDLAKKGLRERIVKLEEAGPASFSVGRFDLITERIDSGETVSSVSDSGQVIKLAWVNQGHASPEEGRVPPRLALCRACLQYIHGHETTCPHCQADIASAEARHQEDRLRQQALINTLHQLLGLPQEQPRL